MKVGTKLALVMSITVLIGVVPISFHILKSQESGRLDQVKSAGLTQVRFISKIVLNFLSLNGANLSLTKIDTSDLLKQMESFQKIGLIELYIVFLSSDTEKNGTLIASWPRNISIEKLEEAKLRHWLKDAAYTTAKCHNQNISCVHFKSTIGLVESKPVVLTRMSFSKDVVLKEVVKLRYYLVIIIALVIPSVILMGLLFHRKITAPLRVLEKATRQIAKGNFDIFINIHSKDEFASLSDSFNKMSVALKQYIEELGKKNEELNAARIIQRGLFPKSLPKDNHFLFGANFSAMTEVGGDLYDVIPGKNGYGILIADVSGHGIPAALVTAMTKMVVNARQDLLTMPAKMVSWLNESLYGQMSSLFVTLVYGFLDASNKTFTFTNAAHPAIIYMNCKKPNDMVNENLEFLNTKGGMVGPFADTIYEQKTIPLHSGDRIVLYTDGITEIRSPMDEMYSTDRLSSFLIENKKIEASSLCKNLFCELFEYHGNEKNLEDDATILVVDVL